MTRSDGSDIAALVYELMTSHVSAKSKAQTAYGQNKSLQRRVVSLEEDKDHLEDQLAELKALRNANQETVPALLTSMTFCENSGHQMLKVLVGQGALRPVYPTLGQR